MRNLLHFLRRWRDRIRFNAAYGRSLNRRAEVEQVLFDCASGVRPLPDAALCRQLALRLGTPEECSAKMALQSAGKT